MPVYAWCTGRLLSDADLTSNERMVVRRWADDGKVEVLATRRPGAGGGRAARPAGADPGTAATAWTAGPLGRPSPAGCSPRCPAPAGPVLVRPWAGERAGQRRTFPAGRALLARAWRCPEPGCRSSAPAAEADSPSPTCAPTPARSPSRRRRCGPACRPAPGTARLGTPGRGPAPRCLSVRIDGVVRQRFVVTEERAGGGRPRARGRRRDHARPVAHRRRRQVDQPRPRPFALHGGDLVAQDISTNGTGIRPGGSMDDDRADRAAAATDPGAGPRTTWSSSTRGAGRAGRGLVHRRRHPADLGDGRGADHGDPPAAPLTGSRRLSVSCRIGGRAGRPRGPARRP